MITAVHLPTLAETLRLGGDVAGVPAEELIRRYGELPPVPLQAMGLGLGMGMLLPAGQSGSTPSLAISGAEFWIHAEQGVSESSGNLTAWTDGSGNGRDCTLIGTPTVDATAWNGTHQAVKFDGSSSAIRAGAGAGETIGGVRHEATIVTVFELVSYTLYNMIVGFGLAGSSSFTNCHLMYTTASGNWRSFRGTASHVADSASAMTVGRYCMIEKLELNGAVLESSMWLNGTNHWLNDPVDSATNFTFDRYIIGRSPADGGTPYWTEMNLVEAILYDTPLTDTQCGDIYTHVAAYWGGI